MHNDLKRPTLTFLLSLAAMICQAQDTSEDVMRSNGKIYVVVAIVVTIVIGIFIYLLNLDRKIKKLEKEN